MKSRTIDENLNRRLRLTLEKYKDIESPAVGLFPIDNIYGRPPYFAFRFKNGTRDDYEKLTRIIIDFKGRERWTMSGKDGFKNQLIGPMVFNELREKNGHLDKDWLINQFEQRYFDICDNAAEDVEPLTQWIESRLL
jgi:hypothetical protein